MPVVLVPPQMAHERSLRDHHSIDPGADSDALIAPGRRTLTAGLQRTMQRKATGAATRLPSGTRELDPGGEEAAAPELIAHGLPAGLRGAMEGMSGIDLSDVRVHHGSSRPAEVQAHAFAQGSDIHLASGQEHHLAHEAWHVVQQKQGRVAATMQMAGSALNADPGLELEADTMGARATELAASGAAPAAAGLATRIATSGPLQLVKNLRVGADVRSPIDHPGRTFQIAKVDATTYDLRDTANEELVAGVAEWKVVPVAPPAAIGAGPAAHAHEHRLVDDTADQQLAEKRRLRTPQAVKSSVSGKATTHVTGTEHADFHDSAHLGTTVDIRADAVTITMVVRCNPSYMCERPDGTIKDLVVLYLATGEHEMADCIAAIEPTEENNKVTLTATYTYPVLARIVDSKNAGLDGAKAKAWLEKNHPSFAVNAFWLAKGSDGNGFNHRSGGMDEKGGSGKVLLKAPTLEELAETETSRIEDWNRGEILHEGRAVYDEFSDILQAGKELATTLEAESEFMVDNVDGLNEIVRRMAALVANPACWPEFGLVNMSDKGQKIYTDTYYDVVHDDGVGTKDFTLLQNEVVLRRRSVVGDPAGTFLFAVKGRDVHMGDETIRLAAQCQLDEAALATPEGQEELRDFLIEYMTDNAFQRVLDDALETKAGTNMEALDDQGYSVKPVMTVESTRRKFFMVLDGGTGIDFSADVATGWMGTEARPAHGTATVCSFEFGVGHPGLAAVNSGGGAVGGGGGDSGSKSLSERAALFEKQANAPKFARPYHVPEDLDNKRLFKKNDYTKYQKLRDDIIAKALGKRKAALPRGGNKSSVIAAELGMIAKKEPPQRAQPQPAQPKAASLPSAPKSLAPSKAPPPRDASIVVDTPLYQHRKDGAKHVVTLKTADRLNASKLAAAYQAMADAASKASDRHGGEGTLDALTFTGATAMFAANGLIAALAKLV